MAEYGLLGQNLKYSFSKKIHESYGLYDYGLFEKNPGELDEFFKNRSWHGINVTIPYKQAVIKYCDEISAIAQRIGAVNTIYEKQGKLIGDNTDYYGFLHTLNLADAQVQGKKVLILGRGGAAKCVEVAMKDRKAKEIWLTSREDLKCLSKFKEAQIIVNATPLGTAKTEHEGKTPCDLSLFKNAELVIDLVYNPAETPLLAQAKALGIKCLGGMEMLKFQADKSAHRFMSEKNIILIGMPGCGKSHIGRVIAAKTGRQFLDTDGDIKKTTGKYAEEIIKQQGIPAFRALEYETLVKLTKFDNAVISTGGGIVTYDKSFDFLASGCPKLSPVSGPVPELSPVSGPVPKLSPVSGPVPKLDPVSGPVPKSARAVIVWIERDLDKLGTKHRPLSKDPAALYDERAPLYEDLADIIVFNNGSPEDCVSEIKRMCKI